MSHRCLKTIDHYGLLIEWITLWQPNFEGTQYPLCLVYEIQMYLWEHKRMYSQFMIDKLQPDEENI